MRLAVLAALAAAASASAQERPFPSPNAGGHTARVTQALFRPGHPHELLTASEDKTVRVWDVRARACLAVLRPPVGPGTVGALHAAAVAPDGRTLAVAGFFSHEGSPIYLIDLDGARLVGILAGHAETVSALDVTPDGRRLVSGGGDGYVRVWDLETRKAVHEWVGHKEPVRAVAVAPDGRTVASGSADRTVRLWSLEKPGTFRELKGHRAAVACLAWSPDGNRLASGGADGVRLWDATGSAAEATVPQSQGSVRSLRFAPDGRRLFGAFCTTEGTDERPGLRSPIECRAAAWIDLDGGTFGPPLVERLGSGDSGPRAALSPDGAWGALVGGGDHELTIWDVRDVKKIWTAKGTGRTPAAVALGADSDGPVVAWAYPDATTGRLPPAGTWDGVFHLTRLRLLPEGPREALGLLPGRAALDGVDLKVENGRTVVLTRGSTVVRRLPDLPYDRPVRGFSLLDGGRVAYGGGPFLRLYRLGVEEPVKALLGLNGDVRALAGSADGRFVVGAFGDQTLRIWDLKTAETTVQPALTLLVVGGAWVAWTPKGYYAASDDGERLFGWTVNRPASLGAFSAAGQYRHLRRPELLSRLFGPADE